MAVDYFLKLANIQGESVDEKHKNEIQILSWSWGGTQTSSVAGTGGSGAGKVSLTDFSVQAFFDKSTPLFFKTLCAGTHIPTGTMTAVKSGGDGSPYLTVDFTEMFVSSLQLGAGGEVPSVSITFTYNTIKIEYKMQTEKGTLESTGAVSYDLKQNKLAK